MKNRTWHNINKTPLPEPISIHSTPVDGKILLFGYDQFNFLPRFTLESDFIIQEKMIDGCIDNLKITHWMHIDTKELI